MQGKVNSKMASSFLHSGVGARIARVGAIAITAALGGTLLLNVSQPQPASAQAKKDAKAPVKAPEGSWVKLCEKNQIKGKDKDGKDVTKAVENCMTLTEQIHPDTGITMIGATLSQFKIDGKEMAKLQITVPPGLLLPAGAAMTVFPKDLWEKVQKDKLDKADYEKLKKNVVKLTYTYCLQISCLAEAEATPEVINLMKGGGGFMVDTVRAPTQPVSQPVPLGGFAQALAGPPTDTQKFKEARTALMQQISERQKHLIAELKKQQEDLNKMQPNVKADEKKKK